MTRPEEKRLVYLPKALLDKMASLAVRQGETATRLIEKSLEASAKIMEEGYSLDEAVELLRALKSIRMLGGQFVPRNLYEPLVKANNSLEKNLDAWREAGRAHGAYLKEVMEDPLKVLPSLIKAYKWDVLNVELKLSGGEGKLVCVTSSNSLDDNLFLSEYLVGMLEGLGHSISRKEVMRGLLMIEFTLQR